MMEVKFHHTKQFKIFRNLFGSDFELLRRQPPIGDDVDRYLIRA
jgi:hypothetical protein